MAKEKLFLSACVSLMVMLLACNNNDANDSTAKDDSTSTTTIAKESQPMKSIKGSSGYINVDDQGVGGIPVLFVHSFGGNIDHWGAQLIHLRANRRAIAMDMRGHGMSEAPKDNDYTVQSLANDISAVVDSLKLDRVVLVGHSMGGSAAIAYAGTHPGKVAGLVISGTPGKTPVEQAKPIMASLESDQYDQVMASYMKQLLTGAKPTTDSLETKGVRRISKEASISIIRSVFEYDPLPDLQKYSGPKLIIGKTSEDQPNSLHKALPNITYKTIEGTSHWMQLDDPEAFNVILDDFLSRVQ
ncbi:MAG: alpha/beta hydrolase [Chitinophagaceae bacterium]|nr:alpha/beta hydrolase [Chitinophagaceae bacterium]